MATDGATPGWVVVVVVGAAVVGAAVVGAAVEVVPTLVVVGLDVELAAALLPHPARASETNPSTSRLFLTREDASGNSRH